MKKNISILLLVLIICTLPVVSLAKENEKNTGFDEFGYNRNARIFNGWYGYYDKNIEGGTYDTWLTMKWSKDWIAMTDQPVGAWCTNHLTWYSDDNSEETWFGWDQKSEWNETTEPDAKFRVEEFYKIMKVNEDEEAWEEYEAAGAIDAGWGAYGSGVPKYILFQDSVKIFDVETGELVNEYSYIEGVNKGLGKPIF